LQGSQLAMFSENNKTRYSNSNTQASPNFVASIPSFDLQQLLNVEPLVAISRKYQQRFRVENGVRNLLEVTRS
jgi:flavin reductase (DIM6/NTAB) family NADH-FMN oxidoreductase RutF